MSDSQKTKDEHQSAEKPKLHTDPPLSEKDEVKEAEHKTNKAAAKHATDEESVAAGLKNRKS